MQQQLDLLRETSESSAAAVQRALGELGSCELRGLLKHGTAPSVPTDGDSGSGGAAAPLSPTAWPQRDANGDVEIDVAQAETMKALQAGALRRMRTALHEALPPPPSPPPPPVKKDPYALGGGKSPKKSKKKLDIAAAGAAPPREPTSPDLPLPNAGPTLSAVLASDPTTRDAAAAQAARSAVPAANAGESSDLPETPAAQSSPLPADRAVPAAARKYPHAFAPAPAPAVSEASYPAVSHSQQQQQQQQQPNGSSTMLVPTRLVNDTPAAPVARMPSSLGVNASGASMAALETAEAAVRDAMVHNEGDVSEAVALAGVPNESSQTAVTRTVELWMLRDRVARQARELSALGEERDLLGAQLDAAQAAIKSLKRATPQLTSAGQQSGRLKQRPSGVHKAQSYYGKLSVDTTGRDDVEGIEEADDGMASGSGLFLTGTSLEAETPAPAPEPASAPAPALVSAPEPAAAAAENLFRLLSAGETANGAAIDDEVDKALRPHTIKAAFSEAVWKMQRGGYERELVALMRRAHVATEDLKRQRAQFRQALRSAHEYVRFFCRQQLLLMCSRAPWLLPPRAAQLAATAAARHAPQELPWPCLSVEPLPVETDAASLAAYSIDALRARVGPGSGGALSTDGDGSAAMTGGISEALQLLFSDDGRAGLRLRPLEREALGSLRDEEAVPRGLGSLLASLHAHHHMLLAATGKGPPTRSEADMANIMISSPHKGIQPVRPSASSPAVADAAAVAEAQTLVAMAEKRTPFAAAQAAKAEAARDPFLEADEQLTPRSRARDARALQHAESRARVEDAANESMHRKRKEWRSNAFLQKMAQHEQDEQLKQSRLEAMRERNARQLELAMAGGLPDPNRAGDGGGGGGAGASSSGGAFDGVLATAGSGSRAGGGGKSGRGQVRNPNGKAAELLAPNQVDMPDDAAPARVAHAAEAQVEAEWLGLGAGRVAWENACGQLEAVAASEAQPPHRGGGRVMWPESKPPLPPVPRGPTEGPRDPQGRQAGGAKGGGGGKTGLRSVASEPRMVPVQPGAVARSGMGVPPLRPLEYPPQTKASMQGTELFSPGRAPRRDDGSLPPHVHEQRQELMADALEYARGGAPPPTGDSAARSRSFYAQLPGGGAGADGAASRAERVRSPGALPRLGSGSRRATPRQQQVLDEAPARSWTADSASPAIGEL